MFCCSLHSFSVKWETLKRIYAEMNILLRLLLFSKAVTVFNHSVQFHPKIRSNAFDWGDVCAWIIALTDFGWYRWHDVENANSHLPATFFPVHFCNARFYHSFFFFRTTVNFNMHSNKINEKWIKTLKEGFE